MTLILTCSSCGKADDSSAFHRHSGSKSGFRGTCKLCRKISDRLKYLENKDRILTERKEYWEKVKNLPKVKERRKRNFVAYYENNQEQFILGRCRQRARRSGLPFDLELSDIVVPETCPILKIPIMKAKGKPNNNSPSVDRIDPLGGYTKGNIQIISNLANMMKSSADSETLLMFAKWVFENYSVN